MKQGSTKSLKNNSGTEYNDAYINAKYEYEKVMDAFRSGNKLQFTEGYVDQYLTNGIESNEIAAINVALAEVHYITN